MIVTGLVWIFLAAQSQDTEPYKLTANDVEHFIDHYPKMKTDFENYGVKYDQSSGEFTIPESVKALSDFNQIIAKYGYKDYEDFFMKVSSLFMAYASVKANMGMNEAEIKMKEQLKEVEENPDLSAEQKEMMKQQIEAGLQMMKSYGSMYDNSANVAVVQQYLEKLDELFDNREE